MADTGKKVTKASVNYRPASLGTHSRCGNCVMFRVRDGRGSCTLVEGEISPSFVCDRYEPKTSR